MIFKDTNTIKLTNGSVIKSNLFDSLLIASKTDKATFRLTMLTCLLLDFDNDSKVEDVEHFLEIEANNIIRKYVEDYMPNTDVNYLLDLRLEEFDFDNKFIKQMDSSFYKLYEKIKEQVNIYLLDKIMKSLPI